MIKVLLFNIFVLTAFISFSAAEEIVDLKNLTAQCIVAAEGYQPIKSNFPYKVLHTVEYKGWSGDSDHVELTHPVVMTIKYAGKQKDGSYWYRYNPQKKYMVSAKSDVDGNYELIENIEKTYTNYTFHGVMKDGVIKGLWEKGNGKKAFAFYVKAIK